MTLHEFPALIQRTDEWYDQRRGIVTASVVGNLITPTLKTADNKGSRGLTATLAAERITGWTALTYQSGDMIRGIEDEPRARDTYAEHYGTPVKETGFQVRDDWGFRLGYSPDGLVADDGLIECKSRGPKEHIQHVIADEVPAENLAQIQCGLLVSGRAWCDYLSYCGGLPMWRKRVFPDAEWAKAIVEAVRTFEVNVEQMVTDFNRATEGLPATERVLELEMVI